MAPVRYRSGVVLDPEIAVVGVILLLVMGGSIVIGTVVAKLRMQR